MTFNAIRFALLIDSFLLLSSLTFILSHFNPAHWLTFTLKTLSQFTVPLWQYWQCFYRIFNEQILSARINCILECSFWAERQAPCKVIRIKIVYIVLKRRIWAVVKTKIDRMCAKTKKENTINNNRITTNTLVVGTSTVKNMHLSQQLMPSFSSFMQHGASETKRENVFKREVWVWDSISFLYNMYECMYIRVMWTAP